MKRQTTSTRGFLTVSHLGRIIALSLAVGFSGVACSGSGDEASGKTTTEQQAAQRVQDNVHTAAAQLPQTAHLEQQLTHSVPCDDPTDNGPKGRVDASTTYQIHGLPLEQYPHLFDLLRDWWQRHDYRVLDDSRRSPTEMYLWVENNHDGFRMAFNSNDSGGLFITASSPCVWPNGSPPPSH